MSRILFIEDNDDLRNATIDYLRFEGFQVEGVDCGIKGVEMALVMQPELIVCDILMKDMDGYEVRKRLSNIPETSLIPFIFLSALSEENNIRQGMALGADDYLVKPVSPDTLIKAINTRLEKSKEHKQFMRKRMGEMKDEILRVLPHELLTPLNAIVGFSDIMKDDAGSMSVDEVKEMAAQISENGNRLHSLINNYLTYINQISKKGQEVDTKICCANEMISTVAMKIAAEFGRKVDLISNIEEANIRINHPDFEFFMREIVSNAFKFSKSGTNVIINGRVVGENYEIVITDFGMGFPSGYDDILNEISALTQFNRDEIEQQGSGLGLITSLLIIKSYNGELNIRNNEQGASVKVKLPLFYT